MLSLSARARRVFRKGVEERQDGISGVSLGLPNPVTRDALITALPQPKPLHPRPRLPVPECVRMREPRVASVSRLFPGQRGTPGLLSTLRAGARLGASAQAPSTLYIYIYIYIYIYTHTHTHTHTHIPTPTPRRPRPSILAGRNRTRRRRTPIGAIGQLEDRGRGEGGGKAGLPPPTAPRQSHASCAAAPPRP